MTYPRLLTIADIESFYPNIRFKDNTRPTGYQVENWIGEATDLVYSAISDAYEVPVTDKSSLNILRTIARSYVMENVGFVLNQSFSGPQDTTKRTTVRKVDLTGFYKKLEMIKDGDLNLEGATKKTNAIVSSYNVNNSITPKSSKTENLW